MKISFCKNSAVKDAKKPAVIIVSKDQIAKSKVKFIDFAKKNLDFDAKFGKICTLTHEEKVIILVGSGDNKELNSEKTQTLGAKILDYINGSKIEAAEIFFGSKIDTSLKVKPKDDKDICDLAFGALLKSYRFNKYFENKLDGKKFNVKELRISVNDVKKAQKAFAEQETLANNVFLVRDLVSEPGNVLNPEAYADICKDLKKDGLTVEVLGEKEMAKLGMNSLLGVGQGSAFESKLVVMKWNGSKKKSEKKLSAT